MKVRCLFFAEAKELVGKNTLDLEFKDSCDTAQLVTELLSRYPSLKKIIDNCLVAVNLEYISRPVFLKDGDEVAIIPPLSGG
jgi:molybdopterin converting factor subunit 1